MGGFRSTLRPRARPRVRPRRGPTPACRRDDSPARASRPSIHRARHSRAPARAHARRRRRTPMVATRAGKTPAPAKPRGVAKHGRASAAPTTTTKERDLLRKVQRVADVLSEQRRRAGDAGATVRRERRRCRALSRARSNRGSSRAPSSRTATASARHVERAQTRKAPRGSESSGVASRALNHCHVVVDLTVVGIVRV